MIHARFCIERNEFVLDIDLQLPAHGITAIFGPSGSGKTTLLRAIAGLHAPRNGYLNVAGDVWQDANNCLPVYKRPIGYVFQEPSLFAHLDVRANLEFGLKRLKRPAYKDALQQSVALLGIGHLLARRAHQLSCGEQQRVAIARALAVSPALLLLDEPLAALDQARKQEVLPYIENVQRELKIPILYVSHARDEVARLADYLVLLDAGRVLAAGALKEIFARLDLALAHNADTETVIDAVVVKYDQEYGLSYAAFSGGCFALARNDLSLGSHVRLQIFASDISLTLEHQTQTSILNIFPAIIDAISDQSKVQVTLRLMIGDVALLARITRKSALQLQLHNGKEVYVQIKSVAVLH